MIEVRSRRTILRERVYIYAGLNRIEQAEEARIAAQFGIDVDGLPRGVLVGTVEIIGCMPLKPDDSQAARRPAKHSGSSQSLVGWMQPARSSLWRSLIARAVRNRSGPPSCRPPRAAGGA
jgi:hypothetical protein